MQRVKDSSRSGDPGCLPNLIVIGAGKCATTSLHYYLDLHPEIGMSQEKSLLFFIEEENWPRGVDWYRSQFNQKTKIRGETSANYTAFPFYKGVPERMHQLVPDAKLIYLVRDPIDRMVSEYVHRYAVRDEHDCIENAVRKGMPRNRYFHRSQYFLQIQQYLDYFPAEQIHILDTEDLNNHRLNTLQQVFLFLGVDENFQSRHFEQNLHLSSQKRRMGVFGLNFRKFVQEHLVSWIPQSIRHKAGFLYNPLSREFEKPLLSENLRASIREHLQADTQSFRQWSGRAFRNWSL